MNMINGTLIDLLISAADTLRNETCRILAEYKKNRDIQKRISEKYKDENEYYNEQQSKLAAIARDGISKAEKVFAAKVSDYAGQMEQQLKRHLAEPVNSQFREKLSILNEFGIQPEKIEIDDLLALNGGNQIGLTALAKTLKKVESPYVLKYHTTADYQNDIATVRALTRNMKYIPMDYHSEGCEVYRGITADYVNPNGGRIGGGIKYDSVSLIQGMVSFESDIEKIKGMKDIWLADCSYEEAEQDSNEKHKEQEIANRILTNAGLPPEEIKEPKSGTKIDDDSENSEGMKLARQLGRDAAKARQTLNELIAAGQKL